MYCKAQWVVNKHYKHCINTVNLPFKSGTALFTSVLSLILLCFNPSPHTCSWVSHTALYSHANEEVAQAGFRYGKLVMTLPRYMVTEISIAGMWHPFFEESDYGEQFISTFLPLPRCGCFMFLVGWICCWLWELSYSTLQLPLLPQAARLLTMQRRKASWGRLSSAFFQLVSPCLRLKFYMDMNQGSTETQGKCV